MRFCSAMVAGGASEPPLVSRRRSVPAALVGTSYGRLLLAELALFAAVTPPRDGRSLVSPPPKIWRQEPAAARLIRRNAIGEINHRELEAWSRRSIAFWRHASRDPRNACLAVRALADSSRASETIGVVADRRSAAEGGSWRASRPVYQRRCGTPPPAKREWRRSRRYRGAGRDLRPAARGARISQHLLVLADPLHDGRHRQRFTRTLCVPLIAAAMESMTSPPIIPIRPRAVTRAR